MLRKACVFLSNLPPPSLASTWLLATLLVIQKFRNESHSLTFTHAYEIIRLSKLLQGVQIVDCIYCRIYCRVSRNPSPMSIIFLLWVNRASNMELSVGITRLSDPVWYWPDPGQPLRTNRIRIHDSRPDPDSGKKTDPDPDTSVHFPS